MSAPELWRYHDYTGRDIRRSPLLGDTERLLFSSSLSKLVRPDRGADNMTDTVQDKDKDFEDLAEDDIGIDLPMPLLSDERHRDHCDYLLDALDEQLDQLQSQPSFKSSVRNTTKDTCATVSCADKQQLHEVNAYEAKDDVTSDASEQRRDSDSKKDEYKWRLSQLLGSEQTMGEEYQSDANSAESVCTEDFAVKFKQRMVEPMASSEAHENAQYGTGETMVDYSESRSLLLPVSDDSPVDHLNTARREDILQQFKEELEDDLQAALTKNVEDQASGRYRERKDSVESLGGQISRLSQANHSQLSSLPSLERSSVVSHLSSIGSKEHQPVLLTGNSAVRENMSKTELPQSLSDYQAVRELIPYLYEEQRLPADVEQSDCKTRNLIMNTTDTESAGCPTDTLDASGINRSEGNPLIPTKEVARSTHTVSDSSLPSGMDKKDDAGGTPLPRKNNQVEDLIPVDSSLTEDNKSSCLYKHVAGVPLKSFDAVTVDSDLDSVTTEKVRDHIRKALNNSKGDSSHKTRRFTRSRSSSGRYPDFSKVSTDDEEDFARPLINRELKDESFKRWVSSPIKSAEAPKNSYAKGVPLDILCSPGQAQCRRLTEKLAGEQVLLEETLAKLRRDVVCEEDRLSQRRSQYREAEQLFNDILQQKKEAYHELQSLRDLLEGTQKEVVKMESRMRESQITEEDFRRELVILEYKRSEYMKELQELELELESIRQQCSSTHSSQVASFQYEISSLKTERDELKARLRQLEGSLTFMERQELERQLNNAKSELFSEQRTSRAKIEKLHESLEECQSKLEKSRTDCDEKQEKNRQLKSQLRELEKTYETQIQTQAEEASEQNDMSNQKITDLTTQVREQGTRIASLEKILSEKELDLLKLREVISSINAEKEAQMLAAEVLKEEHNKRLTELQVQHQQDKDLHISKLKEEMQIQKQKEIQQFAENMEQVKAKALLDQAESLKKEMDKVVKSIEIKDKDIEKWREALKLQKESMKKLAADLKQEAREMVHNTLVREQKKWESEKREALQIQRHTLEEEKFQEMADLREALERERRTSMTLEKKCADFQNIIQEHEIHQRSLQREKQEALDEQRAILKEEKQEEMRRLEQELEQEKERDIERLKQRLQQMEEEQHELRAEKNESIFREREAMAQAERAERALAREINAACERMQCIPGRSKVQSPSRSSHGSPTRPSANQALKVLHEVSEETNQFIHKLQQDVEAQKRTSLHLQREKEREFQQLREQLQLEKEKALEMLKERLIQEHIEEITNLQQDQLRESNGGEKQSLRQQLREKDNELRAIQRNMAKWKDETATKLAQKFEEELNAELEKSLSRSKASDSHRSSERIGSAVRRLSLERKDNSHLRSASSPSLNGAVSQHDFSALKILRNLQGRVKELRADNGGYHGRSMEDLSLLGGSYREKRPIIMERSMSQVQGYMRK
ncbi:trichohyalin-like isoform X2 [Hyla sarda]|uniref:trichohyalin-like isoform X2 n=1 Tax=Hyla sarda TaxID=327740 RepID=UPI0024C38081|nr:trichohyalin-like isoform X2 [Hyla sarda]